MKEGKVKDREKDKGSRNAQMHRLKLLIDLLSSAPGSYTPDQMLQHLLEQGLNCSRRLLSRDLEALQSLGCPIKEDQNTNNWGFEFEAASGHAFHINAKALVGLCVLKKLAAPLMDGPFSQDLLEFFATIEDRIGEKGRDLLSELTHSVDIASPGHWSDRATSDILCSIRSACTDRHVLEVEYETVSNGLKKSRLGPQNIYFAQGTFHLIAEDLALKKTKTFALPRFKSALVLNEMYDGITTAPDEMLTNSFAVFMGTESDRIELLFNKELALYVKQSRWHSSQTIKDEADGRVRLKVNLAVNPDFVAWVMSFGDKVEILSPLSLSQEIERQVFNMAERFHLKKVS